MRMMKARVAATLMLWVCVLMVGAVKQLSYLCTAGCSKFCGRKTNRVWTCEFMWTVCFLFECFLCKLVFVCARHSRFSDVCINMCTQEEGLVRHTWYAYSHWDKEHCVLVMYNIQCHRFFSLMLWLVKDINADVVELMLCFCYQLCQSLIAAGGIVLSISSISLYPDEIK